MQSTESQVISTLYKIGSVRFGQFTLKSGQISPIYLDLRKIISYPDLLQNIADLMWGKARNCQFDLICGVPYTALPMATALSLKRDIPMIMRRKEQKSYGTKQKIEGVFQPGQSCLIIEDVITTGSSILETIEDLTAAHLTIRDIIVFIDREQGGKSTLENQHYRLQPIFTLTEILHHLLEAEILPPDESTTVQQLIVEKST
ncbi:MAG: orotate phosphoribosyltransferase [Gammaproteobacteria bacterium RIFCSPHIGHO2_12_FULL_37_14]|nr:MAG: orotate phosphoribosyltransferase [Gammaproteobacteria bacterium RIFCSPHIGHO2_12_FULL_37_14]